MVVQSQRVSREKFIEKTIAGGIADFSRDEILSSVVRAWCSSNHVALSFAERGPRLAQALSSPPAGDLAGHLERECGPLSLKEVEVAFETLIGTERKRAEGAVYTPNYVIDALIGRCLALWTPAQPPLLLDPACGSGGFLVRAIPALATRFAIGLEQVMRDLICGVDVNPDSIECTRLILELFCTQNLSRVPENFDFLLCADALLLSRADLLRKLGLDENRTDGFDVVVTNPPYVKIQNLEPSYRTELNRVFPEFTGNSFNLSQLFLIKGHQLLSPAGVLGAITPNNLFTALSGEEVRGYFQHHQCVYSIVDFGHQKIFRNASAYTCLLFLDKSRHDELLYARCSNAPNELVGLTESAFDRVQVAALRREKWRLAPAHHLRNIEKLERCGTSLGALADIRVGFATLKDSVFLLNDLPQNDAIELDITVPAIKIAAFASETALKGNRRRLIKPYFKRAGRWWPYPESEMRERFPHAYLHLCHHRVELEARDKGKNGQKNFFEWGRSQGMEASGPKLLVKTFNRRPQFLLDETDSLFCNGYSIKPKEQTGLFSTTIDITALQRILNSQVMDYYVRLTSVGIDGDYWCYQKNFIERFCIPEISDEELQSLLVLDGEALQRFICQLFGLSFCDVEEIVVF